MTSEPEVTTGARSGSHMPCCWARRRRTRGAGRGQGTIPERRVAPRPNDVIDFYLRIDSGTPGFASQLGAGAFLVISFITFEWVARALV